jgi:hypothetical protein
LKTFELRRAFELPVEIKIFSYFEVHPRS